MTHPGRGGFVLVARFGAIAALNYVFGLLLAWILVPSQFGQVALLQAALLLIAMTLNSGFPWMLAAAVARDPGGESEDVRRVFRTSVIGNLVLGICLGAVLGAFHVSGALTLGAGAASLIVIAAVTCPFFALTSVGRGALQGATRFGRLAAVQLGEVAIKLAVATVLVVLFGLGIEGVAMGFLAGAVVAAAVAGWFLRDLLPGRGAFAPLSLYAATIPMFVGALGLALLATVDVLSLQLIGESAGITTATIGAYQVGVMLARLPYFVGDAVMDAFFPYIARRHDSAVDSHRYFMSAARFFALAVLPIDVVLAVSPEPLLDLLFPAHYASAAPLVRLLAVGSVGALAMGTSGKALQALNQRASAAAGILFALGVELTLLVALVPHFGAKGAAAAFIGGAWSGAVALAILYYRHQRMPLPQRRMVLRLALALGVLLPFCFLASRAGLVAGLGWLALSLVAYSTVLVVAGLVTEAEMKTLTTRARALVAPRARNVIRRARPRRGAADALVSGVSRRPAFAAAVVVLLAFIFVSDNVSRSPDTLYDEAVYTTASQNVATDGRLTWGNEPVFIHPPLYFLLQGGWLKITGQADGELFDASHTSRLLTSAFTAVAVGLIALLILELASRAGPRRRLVLVIAGSLLAVFDPVLLRFGRLAMIESVAVAVGLLTIYVAWRWRERSAVTWISVVGLLSGISLLVKEITIFLLVVPLIFAVIQSRWALAKRAVIALGIALVFWSTFVAWALYLGLGERFAEEKLLTFERLLGILQVTGWNRPAVSFLEGLKVSAPQYAASYIVLTVGAAVLVWLWLRRKDDVGAYLLAWLLSTYGFGGYTIARGQLNEQFFMYLMPGAIVATVVGADAALAWITRRVRHQTGRRSLRAWTLSQALAPTAVILVVALGAGGWWRLYHSGSDHGIEQITAFVQRLQPRCAAVNASGDVEKYALALTGHRITSFGSGPLAASRGVRYYFFNSKDVFARYGKMNPDLEAWLRRSGRRVVSYPSHTYWGVELWYVDPWPFDPIADIQPIPGGVFVNTESSACGGYPVVDSAKGAFVHEYQSLGGKPVIGRPLSRTWTKAGRTFQAFDTVLLASSRPSTGARPAVRPIRLVSLLAKRRPSVLAANRLPVPSELAPLDERGGRRLLTDPVIAKAYLGVELTAARKKDWERARRRWGVPLGVPEAMEADFIRQPFENTVFERRTSDIRYGARPTLRLGRAALASGLVPADARRPLPVPNLEDRRRTIEPSAFGAFLIFLAASLAAWTVLSIVARSIETRRRESSVKPISRGAVATQIAPYSVVDSPTEVGVGTGPGEGVDVKPGES